MRQHGAVASEAAFLLEGSRVRPGARIEARGGRVALALGRVSVSRAPPLLAEAMRLARPGRRVPAPRWGVIAASPSLGASAGAIDGCALSLRGGRSGNSMWSFAGARSRPGGSREALGGIGLGAGRGRTRAAASFGAVADAGPAPDVRRVRRSGSITVVHRAGTGGVAIEALGGAEGRALLAEVTERGEAVFFAARWRYRSWSTRPVAADLSAETRGSGPRARLTWRSWSSDAVADDGLLEVEASGSPRGAAPVRLRLGAVGLGGGGAGGRPREAYGLLDATVARGGGRSLGVHVLRRASAAVGSNAGSTTVGARLDVGPGRVGQHSLLIESTRVRSGAAGWGIAIAPSGEAVLRSRSKPGLWVTARGAFGTGRARLGYTLERGEDASGPRPVSGTVWIRLNQE